MNKPQWLEKISELLPQIVEVVKNCDEQFQSKCFELLLAYALNEIQGEESSVSAVPEHLEVKCHPAFERFLKNYDLKIEDIMRLINLETGEILARNFPKKKAKAQITMAALIALEYAYKEGKFYVPKKVLINQCKTFGIYNHKNFSTYMKNAKYGTSAVFSKSGEGWEIPFSQEEWIANIIKHLLGFTKE